MGQRNPASLSCKQNHKRTFTFQSVAPNQHLPLEWNVSYRDPSTAGINGARLFRDLVLSCDEHFINVFVKSLSISVVHGSKEWDSILSNDCGELTWDHGQDRGILICALEPMVKHIADGLCSAKQRTDDDTRTFERWKFVEIRVDRLDMRCSADSRQIVDYQVCGIEVRFNDRQGEVLFFATFPEDTALTAKSPLLSIRSVSIDVGNIQSAQCCFATVVAFCSSLRGNVQFASINISTTDGWIKGLLTDLTHDSSGSIMCDHASISFKDGSTFSLSGISFLPPGEFLLIKSLDTFYISGLCSLSRTLSNVRLEFGSEKWSLLLRGTHMILLRNLTQAWPRLQWPNLPSISLLSEMLTLEYRGKILVEISDCQIDTITSDNGTNFSVSCRQLSSRMMSTRNSSISGCFASNDMVHNLTIRPGEVSIVSDLMTFDWSLLRSNLDDCDGSILRIPHGKIESFSLLVDFQEAMLTTDKPHTFPSFESGPTATSGDFGDDVLKLFVTELPQLYVKTRVMGERATDLTAKAAGRLASSSVALSAIGSVGALVVTDAIRACSKLSLPSTLVKINRFNSTAFENSPRGMIEQVKDYFQKNRIRFGAAAGSTFGIAIGATIYGLPGMIFGNVIGGKIASLALGNCDTGVSRPDEVVSLIDKFDEEWVFVDFSNEKDQQNKDWQRPVQHKLLWAKHQCDPSAPNAPPGCYEQEKVSESTETVPAYLVPARSVKKGYFPSMQKSLRIFVRRQNT